MTAWLMLSPREACQRASVVGYQAGEVSPDSRSLLMDVLQRWVDGLRERARTDLMSATVRQASAEDAAATLLEAAQERTEPCMAIELVAGECLVLAREDVLRRLGTQGIVERAHREALLRARRMGQPYNEEALRFYESQKHEQPI